MKQFGSEILLQENIPRKQTWNVIKIISSRARSHLMYVMQLNVFPDGSQHICTAGSLFPPPWLFTVQHGEETSHC